MKFSNEEINLAREMKAAGLEWTPSVGNYVFDEGDIIDRESPFQDSVYFILDLKHFIRFGGSVERVAEKMFWLPLWEDTCRILESFGTGRDGIQQMVEAEKAIQNNFERIVLYRKILEHLKK